MTLSQTDERRALTGQAPAADSLTREILAPAVVVVIGAIMTILDAADAMAQAFGVSFAVALVITVLALVSAAVLPRGTTPLAPPARLPRREA